MAKIGIDLGVVCPHRKTRGGCIYCHPYALFPPRQAPISVDEQLKEGFERVGRRYKTNRFLPYFQNETSTAVPLEVLEAAARTALTPQESVGLIVSTRPDYVPQIIVSLLARLSDEFGKPVYLELGLQSAKDQTLELINRGHSVSQFVDAVKRAQRAGIAVGAHTILGLPNETLDDMIYTHKFLADLGVATIKIHHLQVLKGTRLSKMYERGEIKVFRTLREYFDVLIPVLETIPWEIVIHRVFTDSPKSLLVAPIWSETKQEALALLEQEMSKRQTRQGQNADNTAK